MPISYIPIDLNIDNHNNWDINDNEISKFGLIENYESHIKELRSSSEYLKSLPVEMILNYFDSLALHWLKDKDNRFLTHFSKLGVSFLVNFIRRTNLEALLQESLHGNICFLDDFNKVLSINKKMMAHPRGVITHWLAGNVPVLGMISLIQGMITKNINVIKLPKKNGLVLPLMVSQIANFNFITGDITIKGKDLFKSCSFVYCDKDDKNGQECLSVNSNVRVAWGGREAVETVMSLPRRFGTDDVIFGPKYSFAAIGRNSFLESELKDITYKLAMDISVFEQQGCNSPHTVFIEKGGKVAPLDFCKALATSMQDVLKRIPKNPVSANEAYAIVNTRSEYSFSGQVFSSKGTEWTVIYSEEKSLAKACYQRIIFVRPVNNLSEILNYIEEKAHQTIGLCINEGEKKDFAKGATERGIERITDIGKMSYFDYPWDGMFPINRFVRWVSLSF